MNNIPNSIQQNILDPLDQYLAGRINEKDITWWKWRESVRNARDINPSTLRASLIPYYHRFFMADMDFFRYGHTNTQCKESMLYAIEEGGNDVGLLFVELDIIKAAENWADRLITENHPPHIFFLLMRKILHRSYMPDWKRVYDELKQKLAKVKYFGNYKTLEMYCLLMGITLIEQTDLSRVKKDDLVRSLQDHWQFNKYMYSVLIRHIVGFRVDNFASLANSVCSKSYSHYLQWFYKAFKENFDVLCPENLIDTRSKRRVRDLASDSLKKMEDIIKSTKPSTELNELFGIIFPKAINDLSKQSRPKTYEELEAAVDDLTGRYNIVLEQLANAVKDVASERITPEDLSAAFLRFPTNLALGLFGSISTLLAQNPTWQKCSPRIHEQILSKHQEPLVHVEGDYVIEKNVANEVQHVSPGGTGMTIVK